LLWVIGAVCSAFAYAVEPSLSAFSATAALTGVFETRQSKRRLLVEHSLRRPSESERRHKHCESRAAAPRSNEVNAVRVV
jgi:hypothetical protein